MDKIFYLYLQAGLLGSTIILLVILLRFLFKKASKSIICVLWLLAFARLFVPFQIESPLSLQPAGMFSAVSQEYFEAVEQVPSETTEPETSVESVGTAKESLRPITVISVVWLCVAGTMLVYMLISYIRLKYRVRHAVQDADGIWICSEIDTGFLLGYFRPRILLPDGLDEQERRFVLLHEQAHLSRGDNWWKLFGFFCLSLHWYNPVVWLGFILMSRDIEFACDQKVIGNMDVNGRKAYSTTLLNSGKHMLGYTSLPVSFATVSLKQRIRNVLHYKKSALWVTFAVVVAIAIVGVCFWAAPETQPEINTEIPMPTETAGEETAEPVTDAVTEPVTEPVITEPAEPVETETLPPETSPKETEPIVENQPKPTNPPIQEETEESPSEPEPDATENDSSWDISPTIDAKITAYASSLGFQTVDSYSNRKVKEYSYSVLRDSKWHDPAEELYEDGCYYVDQAYQYCKDQNANIENTLLWVEVNYVGIWESYFVYIYCAAAY